MNNKNILKKYLSRATILASVVVAVVINEQLLLKRIKNQKERYEAEKEILSSKIAKLENEVSYLKDTSFRFYEHFFNGADYEDLERLNNLKFKRNDENIYVQYRPLELNEELFNKLDTVKRDTILSGNELFDKQLDTLDKFNKSDSVFCILQNGKAFLDATLEIMHHQNKFFNGNLSRFLRNSDEENDREFKARYFMFNIKAKNKMYSTPSDLTADYYKTLFIKNTSIYKRTAGYMNNLIDSLCFEYEEKIFSDSIKFENDRRKKIDSLLNNPIKHKEITFYDLGVNKFFNEKIRQSSAR